LEPGELLAGTDHPRSQAAWKLARTDSVHPTGEALRAAVVSVAPLSAAYQPPPRQWPDCPGAGSSP